MRIIGLLLVFANLLALAWWQGWLDTVVGSNREPVRVQRQIEADRLSVLAPKSASTVPAEAGVASGRDSTALDASSNATKTVVMPAGRAGADKPIESKPGNVVPTDPVSPKTPEVPAVVADSATPVPTPTAAVESAAATPALASPNVAANGLSAPAAPAEPPRDGLWPSLFGRAKPIDVCFDLTRINEQAGESLRRELEALGGQVTQTGSENRSGYVVYIKPAESFADARQRIVELRSQGVRDIYLIQDGTYRMAVSLGVFRTMESVEVLQGRLRARGVDDALVGFVNPTATRLSFRVRGPVNKVGADKLAPIAAREGAELVACAVPGEAAEPSR